MGFQLSDRAGDGDGCFEGVIELMATQRGGQPNKTCALSENWQHMVSHVDTAL